MSLMRDVAFDGKLKAPRNRIHKIGMVFVIGEMPLKYANFVSL